VLYELNEIKFVRFYSYFLKNKNHYVHFLFFFDLNFNVYYSFLSFFLDFITNL